MEKQNKDYYLRFGASVRKILRRQLRPICFSHSRNLEGVPVLYSGVQGFKDRVGTTTIRAKRATSDTA